MTLQEKIKELREAKRHQDENSSFNDDASVMQRACFHRDLSNMLPKLLDALEIQQEYLEKISRSSFVNIYKGNVLVTKYADDLADEALAKVNDLFNKP